MDRMQLKAGPVLVTRDKLAYPEFSEASLVIGIPYLEGYVAISLDTLRKINDQGIRPGELTSLLNTFKEQKHYHMAA